MAYNGDDSFEGDLFGSTPVQAPQQNGYGSAWSRSEDRQPLRGREAFASTSRFQSLTWGGHSPAARPLFGNGGGSASAVGAPSMMKESMPPPPRNSIFDSGSYIGSPGPAPVQAAAGASGGVLGGYGLRLRRGGAGNEAAINPSGGPAAPREKFPAMPPPRAAVFDPYLTWVLVFGFQPSRVEEVLRRFQGYGSVVESQQGAGNWLFLRFATPLQADRAAATRAMLLSDSVMLAVQKMDESAAKRFGLRLSEDGAAVRVSAPSVERAGFAANGAGSASVRLNSVAPPATPVRTAGGVAVTGTSAASANAAANTPAGNGFNQAFYASTGSSARARSGAAGPPAAAAAAAAAVAAGSAGGTMEDDSDLMQQPPPRKSICERLYAFVFNRV